MKIVFRLTNGIWDWRVNNNVQEYLAFPTATTLPKSHEIKTWFDDFLRRMEEK